MPTEEKEKKIHCDYQYREILYRRKNSEDLEDFLKTYLRNSSERQRKILKRIKSGIRKKRFETKYSMGINEEQSENGPLDIRNDFENSEKWESSSRTLTR